MSETASQFDKIKHPKKRAFLAAYSQLGSISRSAVAAEVSRISHYDWMKADGEEADAYREAFELAKEMAADELETEALRRAKDGLRRLKFHEGLPVIDPETSEPYVEHQYSDTLAIFLLKALRPEKYRERIETEHKGNLHVSSSVTVRHVLDEIGNDESFQEFCRARNAGSDPGLLCGERESGQMENGSSPGAHRPGSNGHRNGQNGKHPGH